MKKSLSLCLIILTITSINLLTAITEENNFKIYYIRNFDFMEGEEKINSFQIENLKETEFKNCKTSSEGEIKEWILPKNPIDIEPLEKKEVFFNTKIPQNIEKRPYFGKIGLVCDGTSQFQEVTINIFSGSKVIEIKGIQIYEEVINLTYSFNNKDIIGEKISLEVWILGEEGNETFRETYDLMINKDAEIEEVLTVNLQKNLPGIYALFIAPSYELDKFAMQRFIIGQPATTGSAIGQISNPKFLAYLLFFIIVLIGIISIIRDQYRLQKTPINQSD